MSAAMFRSIYVPLDGSPFAEQALPLAAEIARRSGAMLQVALVHHPVPALATALEVPEIEAQLDQEARAREQVYLDGIVERLRATVNIPVTASVLEGPVADALQEHIEKSGADFVAITTHGRGPVSRFWLGSVADQLMRRLHVPILLLRPGSDRKAPATFRRILVTLDGSSFAERAIEAALMLGRPFGAEYTLMMALEPPLPIADPSGMMVVPVDPEAERKARDSARAYLDRQVARLRGLGAVATALPVEGAGAAPAIIAQADQTGCDLVAIASHGAGGVERLVVGSVADKVIRGSTHPTLVIRPPRDTR